MDRNQRDEYNSVHKSDRRRSSHEISHSFQPTKSSEGGEDDRLRHNASAEAAGVVRGVSRTVGRSVLQRTIGRSRARGIGRLSSSIPKRPVPTKQVAKVSDRLSTGLNWWSMASEVYDEDENATTTTTNSPSSATKNKTNVRNDWMRASLYRVGAFAVSFVKNTILGIAVYESYGYVVTRLTPSDTLMIKETWGDPSVITDTLEGQHRVDLPTGVESKDIQSEDPLLHLNIPILADQTPQQPSDNVNELVFVHDVYARASLTTHFIAGGMGGFAHGVASTVMENPLRGASWSWMLYRFPVHATHHSIVHATLFGSYESLKRSLLSSLQTNELHVYGWDYLISFTIAGGLAGQIQHVVNHYGEQIFRIEDVVAPDAIQRSRRVLYYPTRMLVAPTVWSVLTAFFPSAIGFIAFEYGKVVTGT